MIYILNCQMRGQSSSRSLRRDRGRYQTAMALISGYPDYIPRLPQPHFKTALASLLQPMPHFQAAIASFLDCVYPHFWTVYSLICRLLQLHFQATLASFPSSVSMSQSHVGTIAGIFCPEKFSESGQIYFCQSRLVHQLNFLILGCVSLTVLSKCMPLFRVCSLQLRMI